jgi:four helix bundle protein
MGVTTFQQLEVWKKAHALVLATYRLTSSAFPREELYGLTSQLRRAMVSAPANIAEGFSKRSKPDKARFYNIAECSLEEARYYLILAKDLGYGDTSKQMNDLDEVARMLRSYSAAVLSSRFSMRGLLLWFGVFF